MYRLLNSILSNSWVKKYEKSVRLSSCCCDIYTVLDLVVHTIIKTEHLINFANDQQRLLAVCLMHLSENMSKRDSALLLKPTDLAAGINNQYLSKHAWGKYGMAENGGGG